MESKSRLEFGRGSVRSRAGETAETRVEVVISVIARLGKLYQIMVMLQLHDKQFCTLQPEGGFFCAVNLFAHSTSAEEFSIRLPHYAHLLIVTHQAVHSRRLAVTRLPIANLWLS